MLLCAYVVKKFAESPLCYAIKLLNKKFHKKHYIETNKRNFPLHKNITFYKKYLYYIDIQHKKTFAPTK